MKGMIGFFTLLIGMIPTVTIGEPLQTTFEEKIESFSDLYDSYGNEIKKSGVYTEAGQWTGQFVKDHPVFEKFEGSITQIKVAKKGGGTVEVIIKSKLSKVLVEYHSMVSKSETKVYNQLADLSLGTWVSFTWTPYPDEETGIKEPSIKERDMLSNPWFIGRLNEIKPSIKIKYYESGKVESKQVMKYGKEDGPCVVYYESGKVKTKFVVKNGGIVDKTVDYYENGQIKSEVNWKAWIVHGKKLDYYENGQIREETNYKDGKLDGKQVEYNENGQIREETNYKDRELHGKWVEYNENGQIREETNYKDGKLDGKWVKYDEEGNIISEFCYDMGDLGDCP